MCAAMNPGRKKTDVRSAILSEQVAADSSGITMMSSPSSSSDSGSLKMDSDRTHSQNTTFGKDMKRMSMLKSENESENELKGSQKRNSQGESIRHDAVAKTMCQHGDAKSKSTDFFLTQFQAQISQMKSAMDAVQNELLSGKSSPTQGTTPVPSTSFVSANRGRRNVVRKSDPGTSDSVPISGGIDLQQTIRYQSQISTSNGLKMKICKSPSHGRRGSPNKKVRKYKARKKKSDEDISDLDENDSPLLKKGGNNKISSKEPVSNALPSGWGDLVPEDVLFKIFSYVVESEGSVPFLTR